MMHNQAPRDRHRRAAFERIAAGSATPRDLLLGLQHPLTQQRRLTARLTLFAAMVAFFARSVAPGSITMAATSAMIIMAVTGFQNGNSAQWLYEAWRLVVEQRSSRIASAGVRRALWGLLGDIWPMVFVMLLLRQAAFP